MITQSLPDSNVYLGWQAFACTFYICVVKNPEMRRWARILGIPVEPSRSTPHSPTPCSASQLLTRGNCSNAPALLLPTELIQRNARTGNQKSQALYFPHTLFMHPLRLAVSSTTGRRLLIISNQSINRLINQPVSLSPPLPLSVPPFLAPSSCYCSHSLIVMVKLI